MFAAIPFLLLFSFANAVPHLQTAPPRNFETLAKLADQARDADRLGDALALYAEAVHLRPSWADGWWWLGSILYEQDRFAEAQAPLKRFISISSKPAPAYAFLALCEYETRDYEHSLLHFTDWAKRGSPGTDALLDVADFHWALLLTRQGRFNEALYILDAKAKKLGRSADLAEAMGLASLRMAFLPEDYPPERREPVWLAGMASLYSSRNELHLSDEFAQRLLLHYGQESNVHYFRGTLLAFRREWDSAAAEFQKELQVSPQHAPALEELAIARVEAFRPNDALTPAKRAVILDPKNARAHYVLGRALLETGSFQESAHELEIAKQLAPESARIRFALSNAYRHLGRLEDSKREQEAFVGLKGKDKEKVPAPPDEKPNAPSKPDQPQ